MNVLINREAKSILVVLVLILLSWGVLNQVITYINAVQLKNQIISHDYALAGYISEKYPELSGDIQVLFTADKSKRHFDTGRILLEKAGYNEAARIFLFPRVEDYYKANTITATLIFALLCLAILLSVYLFLRINYKKIEMYTNDVNKIMGGEISTRLSDNSEGSLSKLAAAINTMTSSLITHIEKEKQSRLFLKDILENISHQLKTPLSALIMYTEIMKQESTDNGIVCSFLNKSENELERMRSLITNLLKMAKLDAGIIELNKNMYDLKDIAVQAAESFLTRLEIEKKSFEIKAKDIAPYFCDREWMLEALSNLIKNAVEHTAEGNCIEVAVEETPLMVKIAVSDNGEGIQPDDINHIFKRFYRSKFSQNKQGTGIGLSLVKTIAEMHGGFVSAESGINKGSAFTITLPKLTKL